MEVGKAQQLNFRSMLKTCDWRRKRQMLYWISTKCDMVIYVVVATKTYICAPFTWLLANPNPHFLSSKTVSLQISLVVCFTGFKETMQIAKLLTLNWRCNYHIKKHTNITCLQQILPEICQNALVVNFLKSFNWSTN